MPHNDRVGAGAPLVTWSTPPVIWSTPLVTRDAQRRVFGVVQGLLEGDKDSSPSVQNDRVFRLTSVARRAAGAAGRQPGQRWVTACHRTPVHRRRPAPGLSAALAEPPGDSPAGASAKKQATCPGIAWCADRMLVHRRPTGRPARSGPPPRSHWPQGQLARAQ